MDVKKMVGGAVLIGGTSRRMGMDKSLVRLAGKPLVEHVVSRLRPQVTSILMVGDQLSRAQNAQEIFITDCVAGRLGPLVGILTALEWYAEEERDVKHVFVTSVDVPFLPADVVEQLTTKGLQESDVTFAKSGGQIQYLAGLWPVEIATSLRSYLEADLGRSIKRFVEDKPSRTVEFAAQNVDPFFNVNTVDDLAIAEELAAKLRCP